MFKRASWTTLVDDDKTQIAWGVEECGDEDGGGVVG
jgi:hypothetical protein